MTDCKNSTIKLFGKTILLPLCYPPHFDSSLLHPNKESLGNEEDSTITSEDNKRTKICSTEGEGEDDEIESKTTPEKVAEENRAEKIVGCPRCKSMNTKFCYYNNYNMNQPRHFCKKCQRYWTAGGTMRNVPVGAGRRKNKNSIVAAHFRHLLLSQSLRAAQLHASFNGVDINPYLSTNNLTSILSFGSEFEKCQQPEQRNFAGEYNTSADSFYPMNIPIYEYSLGKRSREGGIGNQKQPSADHNRVGFFKGFSQSQTDDRPIRKVETSLLYLQANLAASCRSINFLERN